MITRDELIAKLQECASLRDSEVAHSDADIALLSFINDAEVTRIYGKIMRWYV